MDEIAIYPGSFDPPTLGHLDIIKRASKRFGTLIVAVGMNSSKLPLLSTEERMQGLRESVTDLPNVQVASFKGLLID
jgi:pantetheine-phosphate adenylyltransferase